MNRPIPASPRSSNASAQVIVLRPRSSRAIAALWLLLHALLVAAVALVALPLGVKGLLVAALGAHAWWRRPSDAEVAALVLEADDTVRIAVPGEGSVVPDDVTRITPWWVLFEWRGSRERRRWLLFVDQVEAEDWARLSARLRRGRRAPTSDLR